MLKTEIVNKLNEQLNVEIFSVNLYLQISAWCNSKFFEGISKFFKNQSIEEINHVHKLFDYLNDLKIMPIINIINSPTNKFSSLIEVINFSYNHEQKITKKINEIISLSVKFEDYSTFHFLQWFVNEQRKEEKTLKSIIDRILLVNKDINGLFLIDRDFRETKN